jgi:hypothetical protein
MLAAEQLGLETSAARRTVVSIVNEDEAQNHRLHRLPSRVFPEQTKRFAIPTISFAIGCYGSIFCFDARPGRFASESLAGFTAGRTEPSSRVRFDYEHFSSRLR